MNIHNMYVFMYEMNFILKCKPLKVNTILPKIRILFCCFYHYPFKGTALIQISFQRTHLDSIEFRILYWINSAYSDPDQCWHIYFKENYFSDPTFYLTDSLRSPSTPSLFPSPPDTHHYFVD